MKLRLEQLDKALERTLKPVYLLSGDEPLQLNEAADAIRQAARERGYTSRELFYVENGFAWDLLREAADSFSLFASRRILDVRLPGKPDREGAAALLTYAQRPPDDTVLLVTLPRLNAHDQKAPWFQALEAQGVFVAVWPLEGKQLIAWLDRRMASRHLLADRSGLEILAARVEGNLLAAAQEIEKLHILYGSGRITDEQIRKAVADSARYDVYDLAEAALLGKLVRVWRILQSLQAEGVAAAVVLWALTRELRTLANLHRLMDQGESLESACAKLQIRDKNITTLAKAQERLDRNALEETLLVCAQADRIIKGQTQGDAWQALFAVCASMAASRLGRLPLT